MKKCVHVPIHKGPLHITYISGSRLQSGFSIQQQIKKSLSRSGLFSLQKEKRKFYSFKDSFLFSLII